MMPFMASSFSHGKPALPLRDFSGKQTAMIYNRLRYRTMGDRALLVEVGDEIHTAVNEAVRGLFITLEEHPIGGVIDARKNLP
jgi:hypothetical protein